MPFINPIELLRLQNSDPDKINEEAITQALRRLRSDDEKKPVTYRGQTLSEEQLETAIRQLNDPALIRYYHRLCQYPELNNLVVGDCFARVEEKALQDELVTGLAAGQLQQAYGKYLKQAIEQGRTAEFAAFVEQVEKGNEAFQDTVFQSKSSELLEGRLSTIRQLAEQLEQHPAAGGKDSLGKPGFLREQIPVDALNALPVRFAGIRDAFAETLTRIVEALRERDAALALGVARHARRLRADKPIMERLNQSYHQLEVQVPSSVPESAAKPAQRWLPWAWAIILAVLVLGAALLISQFYNVIIGAISSLGEPDAIEERFEEEALNALEEKLSADGSIKREDLEEILRESGNSTQLSEPGILQLPWRERGMAFQEELSGEGVAGAAPMEVCFPPQLTSEGPATAFTVIGDPVYDALVFFFNGRTYFQQAFIPAKSKWNIAKSLNEEELVSTMIIFGQEWSPDVESPCGTPGYFTKNIFYGGFAAYATDPPYLNLHRDAFLQLKKRSLMPARQLKEEKFFDLLDKYK